MLQPHSRHRNLLALSRQCRDERTGFSKVIRNIRAIYSVDRADRMIAMMQNGAAYDDAVYATKPR